MCDTFVRVKGSGDNRTVIFGKNSDREPNEAQVLEHHPPADWPVGATVNCTYIKIPQVRNTRGILISRPFWMWGAEIGVNDAGVAIGNEAVFTKMNMTLEQKLLGMDMLRLALERCTTAETALETITMLLGDHGQGGPCGFEDKKLSYHNSFIIADQKEAWVLETAGPYWAAKKIESFYAISNGLTIGEEFDLNHPDIVEYARKRGWLKPGKSFSFKKTYSDWFYTTFSRCNLRRSQTENRFDRNRTFELEDAFSTLRNHNDSGNYSPDSHLLMNTVCSHAGLPVSRHASQSTASLVSESRNGNTTVWATGTSAPCLSIYKPVWLDQVEKLPDYTVNTDGKYNADSRWWQHEMFHRKVLMSYSEHIEDIRSQISEIESELLEKAQSIPPAGRSGLTVTAHEKEDRFRHSYLESDAFKIAGKAPGFLFRKYWNSQNRKAGIHPFQSGA